MSRGSPPSSSGRKKNPPGPAINNNWSLKTIFNRKILQVLQAGFFSNLFARDARVQWLKVLARPLSAVHRYFCLRQRQVAPSVNRPQHRDYLTLIKKCAGFFFQPLLRRRAIARNVCYIPYPIGEKHTISTFVDQTHIQRTRPHRKTVSFKTSLPVLLQPPTEHR